jgi:hypothetical protein
MKSVLTSSKFSISSSAGYLWAEHNSFLFLSISIRNRNFFFFWWGRGLKSVLHAYKAGSKLSTALAMAPVHFAVVSL